MPNQHCLDVTKQILSCFWGNILGQEIPKFYDPIYSTTLLYDVIRATYVSLYITYFLLLEFLNLYFL